MTDSLRLITAAPEVQELLLGVLSERGVAYQIDGEMVVLERGANHEGADCAEYAENTPERVIGLLRNMLSAPEREAVSVVEELNYPHEFPVTTRLEAWWSVFETSWLEKAVAANAFSVWFQPVVDTVARQILGHECVIRMTKGHRREGAEIMAAAAAHHDLRAFDSYARRLAIRASSAQNKSEKNRGVKHFINFIPSTIDRPSDCLRETVQLLNEAGLLPENIVLEAVQSNRDPDIVHLRRIGNYLREQGLGFALDDVDDSAGALRLMCDVRPDYIKLEKNVVHRMDQARHATAVRKLVEVAGGLGVRVIAKGVERVATMEQLWSVGVHCMQGYLFGSPAPEMTVPGMELENAAMEFGDVDSVNQPTGEVPTSQALRDASSYQPESVVPDQQRESAIQ